MMEMAFSLITLLGMAYAAYRGLKWLFRAGKSQTQRDRMLTPHDLKALEESADRLMSDLRTLTDECVARIDAAIANAETRLDATCAPGPMPRPEPTGLTGEIQLVKNLQKLMTTARS